jgi:hypothetical protein
MIIGLMYTENIFSVATQIRISKLCVAAFQRSPIAFRYQILHLALEEPFGTLAPKLPLWSMDSDLLWCHKRPVSILQSSKLEPTDS